MAQKHTSFIWYELMTTDQPAAEAFYRAVVGWQMADAGQPGMRYTILSAGQRGVGGLMALPKEAREAGVKPGWTGYIAVADTDATAQAILRLIDDPGSRAAARGAGLAIADRYRWPNVVRPLAAAIEEVDAWRTARSSPGLLSTVGRYYGRRTVDHALGLARSGAPFRRGAAGGEPRLI